MKLKGLGVLVALLAGVGVSQAQEWSVVDRVLLGTAGCTLRTGAGSPESVVTGSICDTYWESGAGRIYRKLSGTATTTGWVIDTTAIGTTGQLTKFTGAGVVGDSIVKEVSGNLGISNTSPNYLITAFKASVPGVQLLDSTTGTGASSGLTIALSSGDVFFNQRENKYTYFHTNNTEAFRVSPTQALETSTYASQTTGWQLTRAGALDVRYLFTNELRALLFTAEKESVLKGALRVSKSFGIISQTFTCPASGGNTTLWVFDDDTFGNAGVFSVTVDDTVTIHSMTRTVFGPFTISDCIGTVNNYTDGTAGNEGQQAWLFTRKTGVPGNGGSMAGSTTVPVNELVQDMGVTGNGYAEIVANDGTDNANAPYFQIPTWVTSPTAANTTVRLRLGQLKGITSTSEYGLLAGSYSGDAYVRLSDVNAEIVGIPLIMKVSGTPTLKLDPTVPSIALGTALPSFSSGTGIWMGKDSSVYKLRVGTTGGNRIVWDDTNLTVKSLNLTIDSSGVGIGFSTAYADTSSYRFTPTVIAGSTMGLYAQETSSPTYRYLALLNTVTNTNHQASTLLQAQNSTASLTSSIDLYVNGFTGVKTITASTGTFVVTAAAATFSGAVALSALGGSGNRTVCVDNGGTVYTVASGAAC